MFPRPFHVPSPTPALALLLGVFAFLPGCVVSERHLRFPEQNAAGMAVSDRGKAIAIEPALRIIIDRSRLAMRNFSGPFYGGTLRFRVFNRSAEPALLLQGSVTLRHFVSDTDPGRVYYAEPVLERDVVIEPHQEVLLRFERVYCSPAHFRLTATYRSQGREHHVEVPMEVYD